jgi:two-component system cell cycle sensor histidine kinase PleC
MEHRRSARSLFLTHHTYNLKHGGVQSAKVWISASDMRLLTSLSTREEPRYRTERLKQVVAALMQSVVVNPVSMPILFIPFLFWGHSFGAVPLAHLATAFVLHLSAAAVAVVLFRRYRTGIADEDAAERRLIVLQCTFSVIWGLVGWLFWQQGNGINNIYITMIMVGVVWAVMNTRLSHSGVFAAGVIPLVLVFGLRVLTAPGSVAALLSAFFPVWTVYVLFMSLRGRRRIDAQLKMQFANEDLQAALRASTEEALRKRYEAEAANSAKTTFLANMSHELRTPLNAILGFSDIISQQVLGAAAVDRYAEYARDIHTSGTHLLSLINDLLDIAKIEAGKMEIDPRPLDTEGLIDSVERLMMPRARARAQKIVTFGEPGMPWVVADERAVKQILLNLVSNAIKFTPEGGRIEIACRRKDDGVLLCVRDNGPGIAPEKMDRVFQPFSQIDNRYGRASGGTGLGLALVRGLAELHGGRAWIDSALGEGTAVSVYFPLSAQPPVRAAVANG